MGISYVGSAVGSVCNGSDNFDITLPTCLENDIVVIATSSTQREVAVGVNTAGYTQICSRSTNVTGTDSNLFVHYKKMGATPDTSVNIKAVASTSAPTVAVVYALRAVDGTTPLDCAAVVSGGGGAVPNCPAITTVTPGAMVLAIGAGTYYDTSVTPPIGYTDKVQWQHNDSTDLTVAIASIVVGSAGNEDPSAWTDWDTTSYRSNCSATVALRPAEPEQIYDLLFTGSMSIAGEAPEMLGTLRESQLVTEVVSSGNPIMQSPQLVVEVLHPNPETIYTSTRPIVFICT